MLCELAVATKAMQSLLHFLASAEARDVFGTIISRQCLDMKLNMNISYASEFTAGATAFHVLRPVRCSGAQGRIVSTAILNRYSPLLIR